MCCRPDLDSLGISADYWLGPMNSSDAMNNIQNSKLGEIVPSDDIISLVEDAMSENEKAGLISKARYNDFIGVTEETNHIIEDLKKFLSCSGRRIFLNGLEKSMQAQIEGFLFNLKLQLDGTPAHMSVLERCE